MKQNFFFVTVGLFFFAAVHSQSPERTSGDSINILFKAANEAYETYDYNSCIAYSSKLIELASQENNVARLYDGYNFLGITYEVLEDTIRAKENYEKALVYARASNNDTLLWYAYNNLGNVLSMRSETQEEGLASYEKAIEIIEAAGNPKDALTPVINIAWTHLENGNHTKAAPYLERAWKLSQEQKDKTIQSNLLTLFGMYHSNKKEFDKSRDHFEEAVAVAEEDTLLIPASFAYKEFSKMLVESRNFEEAYRALQKHQEYREEIFQKEKNHQREVVYGRFQTEEYKKDLATAKIEQIYKDEMLAKTRDLTVIMIILLIIMFVFLVLLLRSNQIRKHLIGEMRTKNSELKIAKEKAENLSLLKTRFFSTVSHELRTPLYGVVGLASLLLDDSDNEKQREDLKSLKFSADYLLALINDVLQMNKMESNLVNLEKRDFQIDELLSGIVKSFETSRNSNHNKIELFIDKDIPKSLKGDAMRLSQIMMNLVGNAVKFTQRGKVWIKAEKKSGPDHECYIYFEVGDTGQGIPEDKQQEIFEEFSQLNSYNISYQGTGLGLPIVKKLLKLFDSEIHLQSAPGKGAVFSFEIGFEKGKEKVIEELIPLVNEQRVAEVPRKVLIVDDNRINQVVTKRILEGRDFKCFIAGSGEEALEILKAEQMDVVLMDVNMPGMNGMETTSEIRRFEPTLPIIALTAVEVGEMREEILATGMNDIINKPYNIQEFFDTIFKNLLQPHVVKA